MSAVPNNNALRAQIIEIIKMGGNSRVAGIALERRHGAAIDPALYADTVAALKKRMNEDVSTSFTQARINHLSVENWFSNEFEDSGHLIVSLLSFNTSIKSLVIGSTSYTTELLPLPMSQTSFGGALQNEFTEALFLAAGLVGVNKNRLSSITMTPEIFQMLRIRRVKFGPAKETDDLVRIMEQLNRGDEADNAKLVAQVLADFPQDSALPKTTSAQDTHASEKSNEDLAGPSK